MNRRRSDISPLVAARLKANRRPPQLRESKENTIASPMAVEPIAAENLSSARAATMNVDLAEAAGQLTRMDVLLSVLAAKAAESSASAPRLKLSTPDEESIGSAESPAR